MADSIMSYAIVAGIFAFLAAVCFAARAKRYHAGFAPDSSAEAKQDSASA